MFQEPRLRGAVELTHLAKGYLKWYSAAARMLRVPDSFEEGRVTAE